jgi:hypothetical protein
MSISDFRAPLICVFSYEIFLLNSGTILYNLYLESWELRHFTWSLKSWIQAPLYRNCFFLQDNCWESKQLTLFSLHATQLYSKLQRHQSRFTSMMMRNLRRMNLKVKKLRNCWRIHSFTTVTTQFTSQFVMSLTVLTYRNNHVMTYGDRKVKTEKSTNSELTTQKSKMWKMWLCENEIPISEFPAYRLTSTKLVDW